jgi:AcrR family transcriptional regulator
MPRPRSDQKRTAILNAAVRVIDLQGLGAPTAGIAKEAGISNGSLFTYFETKTELFNQLYLELKSEMAASAMKSVRPETDLRQQSYQAWHDWTFWAVSFPEKRRTLAQLSVSSELASETVAAGHKIMSGLASLFKQVQQGGPMKTAPLSFVLVLMQSVAEATMDFMTQDQPHAKKHCKTGFDALWRMLA